MTITKAVNGTWFCLAEYEKNEKGIYVPCFIKAAQIGNPDYVDAKGEILNENEFYILKDKEFHKAIYADGILLIKTKSQLKGDIQIHKCVELKDSAQTVYVVQQGKYSAHGTNIKRAISDLQYKILSEKSIKEHAARIKKQGYVMREDYRLITGACQFGVQQFCKDKGISDDVEKISIDELFKILDDKYYGAVKFKELFK